MAEVSALKDTIAKSEGDVVRFQRELFFGDPERNELGSPN